MKRQAELVPAYYAEDTRFRSSSLYARLFPPDYELVPQLNEVYELELAVREAECLSREELIRNGAYFARVGGVPTRHFLMCNGEPVRLPKQSRSRLRAFFSANQFKTGYATHGLFPYRGKFHPQMVKALMNVMGLKPGDTVVDPMMGSGTVLIEACLMGIRSVGVDASPFCRFMAQVKLNALTLPLDPVRRALRDSRSTFEHFALMMAVESYDRPQDHKRLSLFTSERLAPECHEPSASLSCLGGEDSRVLDFLLLAYLDSVGYSARSNRRTPFEKFHSILERYLFVAEKIQRVLAGAESDLAPSTVIEGDARRLPLGDGTVDGVLFSPPYSFAIDYLENDLAHLRFLGVDVPSLRERMIGLRGRNLREKFELYQRDMDQVLGECARILRPQRMCTIVVGTNNLQLSRILNVRPEDVPGIDQILIDIAQGHGLRLVATTTRQVTGLANTMRAEHILMLRKT